MPVYELRRGAWVEVDQGPQRLTGWRRLLTLVASAFAIAVLAAFAIAAAILTVVLLPLGMLVVWLAERRVTPTH